MFSIDFFSLSDNEIKNIASGKLKRELELWEKNIWQFINEWFNSSSHKIKVFTSGSSGKPKQIEHSKQAMLNSAAMTCTALNLHQGDNALLCLPADKIGGMMTIIRSIYCKMNLYCVKPSASPLSKIIDEIEIDFAAFTPMQLGGMKHDYQLFRRTERLKKIILGGEDVRAELQSYISTMSNEVYATFGMTETISHIALKRLNGKNPDAHFKVFSGIKISKNEKKCLIIEAPELGQLHLVTNDVVNIISEKEFDWLGRIDNVINSGGVKIYPEEIEQKLAPHIESPFFISSVPDEITSEKVVIVIESNPLNEKDIQELKELISVFNKIDRPKVVFLVPAFLRTENGKVKRKESLQNAIKNIVL